MFRTFNSLFNSYNAFAGEPDKIPPAGLAGCFTIHGGRVSDYMENMGNHTTPLRCMIKCFQLGYAYAGIKLGYITLQLYLQLFTVIFTIYIYIH